MNAAGKSAQAPLSDARLTQADFKIGFRPAIFFAVLYVRMKLARHLNSIFGAPGRLWPYRNWVIVTRHADVREVLEQDGDFEVYYGDTVRHIGLGPNFLLGLQDGENYQRCRKEAMRAFRLEDSEKTVAKLSSFHATRLLEGSESCGESTYRIDAIENLITRVPLLVCKEHYGVEIQDSELVPFSHWTFAISAAVFGDPYGIPAWRSTAKRVGPLVTKILDRSISRARSQKNQKDTVLGRLISENVEDKMIRTYLLGMIVGFVPTNTQATGNALDYLLAHPTQLYQAKKAAHDGDSELLWRYIVEALRWKTIRSGPFRRCASDYIIARGSGRSQHVRKDQKVIACSRVAMFDSSVVENPNRFDPNRSQESSLVFGHGLHWCLGAHIAQAQITHTIRALLLLDGLQRCPGRDGKMSRLGPFPQHLMIEFNRISVPVAT